MGADGGHEPIDETAPGQLIGPTRPGHGVVVVELTASRTCFAVWFDLGAVEFAGELEVVLAWARAQPAAEHLLVVPDLGDEVPLDGARARAYLSSHLTM